MRAGGGLSLIARFSGRILVELAGIAEHDSLLTDQGLLRVPPP